MSARPEVWLRGPIEGVPPHLMPAAHALLQAAEDIERVALPLSTDALWARPAGVASIGFHVRHIGCSVDRLFTYARGRMLDEAQLAALAAEGEPGEPPATAAVVVTGCLAAIDTALARLRTFPEPMLLEPRSVGRAGLPSTVLGLLFHAAEHTQRHTGQIITTAKVVTAA